MPLEWKSTSARRPDRCAREAGKGVFVGLKVTARSGEGIRILFLLVQSRNVYENKENNGRLPATENDISLGCRVSICEELLKSPGVLVHREVVEEDVARAVGPRHEA